VLPTAISVSSSGEIYVAATTSGNVLNNAFYPSVDAGGATVAFVMRLASADLSVVWKSTPIGPLAINQDFVNGCTGLATRGTKIVATCNTTGDVALGSLLLTGKGGTDVLVASLQDSNGSVGWARLLGGTDLDTSEGVAIAPVTVTDGQGGAPLFVKLNPDGSIAWVKRFLGPTNGQQGDDSSECEVRVSVGTNGNVGVMGRIYGTWTVDSKAVNPTAMTQVDASRCTDTTSHGFIMMLSP
jgi:hypothetical protein